MTQNISTRKYQITSKNNQITNFNIKSVHSFKSEYSMYTFITTITIAIANILSTKTNSPIALQKLHKTDPITSTKHITIFDTEQNIK